MNINFLGMVFTISFSEVLGIIIFGIGIVYVVYIICRFYLLRFWYKKCPKCSGRVIEETESYAFSDGSKTSLNCIECNWEKRIL